MTLRVIRDSAVSSKTLGLFSTLAYFQLGISSMIPDQRILPHPLYHILLLQICCSSSTIYIIRLIRVSYCSSQILFITSSLV